MPTGGPHPRFTPDQVARVLESTNGLMYQAAKRLKCNPQTVYNYCERYPEVQAVRDAQRGQLVDLAEQKLRESIANGEAWGITLCLKTLGKDRGYVERVLSDGQTDVSALLKAVLLELVERQQQRNVTPEADWAPALPATAPRNGAPQALPAPPAVDDAEEDC